MPVRREFKLAIFCQEWLLREDMIGRVAGLASVPIWTTWELGVEDCLSAIISELVLGLDMMWL